MNKAQRPPPPSAPRVDGRKDDPNVDALSSNIDWIGPPEPRLNANETAGPFLTATASMFEGGVSLLNSFNSEREIPSEINELSTL